jgi:hypothetical protein
VKRRGIGLGAVLLLLSCAGQPAPDSSTPPADKIDDAIAGVAARVAAEGPPFGPSVGQRHSSARVHVDDRGRIQSYVVCSQGDRQQQRDALSALGADVQLATDAAGRLIHQAWIPAQSLSAVAALPFVLSIDPPGYRITR